MSYMNIETFIIFEDEVIRLNSRNAGGMNQKEDVDALGKSRQVGVFLECRETWGLSFHVRVNGDTIRKTKMKG